MRGGSSVASGISSLSWHFYVNGNGLGSGDEFEYGDIAGNGGGGHHYDCSEGRRDGDGYGSGGFYIWKGGTIRNTYDG